MTRELLPSIRRGDADVADQQARMAETLTEAIGRQVSVLGELVQVGNPTARPRKDPTTLVA
ncbi:hypothetical protein [Peterkaempfera bronchialis]|uniref:Uncharacterized protein n=1 Tax=Peterkaempfera bronchialis TaxID=2126346 RepID=A0A345SY55_9ACTN|nr:hypothetical protein [Peterkaempfera bronchialis]AXI78660.1 hypothetical protein C7M71_015715 [Peterkaempfera bronchialis]